MLQPVGKQVIPHRRGLPLSIFSKNKKTPMVGSVILLRFDIALTKIVYYGQKTKWNRGERGMESSDTGAVKKGRGRPKGKKSSYTVSEKALAQRRNTNCPLKVAKAPAETKEEFDYNSRLITHVMRVNEIATHADRSNINTLKECFIAYIQLCQEDGFPVGNLAAYSAMGFYASGSFDAFIKRDDPDIRALGTLVKATCSMMREGHIANGKVNPVIGIFWQRNYDGLRNDTEQIQAIREQEEESVGSSYKEKYKNLIGE